MRFNFWTRWTSFHSQLKWKSYACDIRVSTRASEMRVVNCGQHMWWFCYLTVLSIQMACKGPKNVWLIKSNEVWRTGKWTAHQIVRSGIYKMKGQPIWLPTTNFKDWHMVASLLPPTVRRVVCPCLAAVLSAWHRYQPQLYCFLLECLYVFHHGKTWFWQTAIITRLYICGPILSSRQQHSHVRYRHKTEGRGWRCLPSHRSERQHVDWSCSQCDPIARKSQVGDTVIIINVPAIWNFLLAAVVVWKRQFVTLGKSRWWLAWVIHAVCDKLLSSMCLS